MASSLRRQRSFLFVVLVLIQFFASQTYKTAPQAVTEVQPSTPFATPSTPSYANYEVVTTNYGWNTPSTHNFPRRILTGEFFNATLAHPRYNASAWADLEAHPDPDRKIIAFLDVDTCAESNYPVYNAKPDWRVNMEQSHPVPDIKIMRVVPDSCQYIKRAAMSPALRANPESRLVLLDCVGSENVRLRTVCNDPSVFESTQVIVAYYCIKSNNVRPFIDVGLPPPAIKHVNLTTSQREAVQSCQMRKYLFSFQGKGGFGRDNLLAFEKDEDFYIRIFNERTSYQNDIRTDGTDGTMAQDSNNFKGVMSDSVFAGSPRGDLLFSYRFAEILSAGAVPVVYADGWLPPFNEHVIDWSKCAVFIPESEYGKTAEILRAIPEEKRCEMQRCALDAWDKFVSNRAGWVRALVAVALSTSAFGVDPLETAF
mmetsp:Transcript_26176/g.55233  ORF Transcript_26176/g.55233 Transcript_26176/m.55233 type:complete len:426 (+) Transcript_26176:213-1490(+)|eukprot:CAMPEP_0183718268 /NCGR_PEP_ID=MMETSP0737-20130205/11579_1 /TAXON_ID=385413 /ORGANISM="Thalassiosira miniscula, Strain CCMP1093" /LENGTH=425 /DNA_ID=CAMNT_0025947799 /DNA_START=162 /DNA_END=1442 /DNA_ORIENTATION=-